MSQSHSKHDSRLSEAAAAAMHEQDRHTEEKQHPGLAEDSIPPSDTGGHARSAAAHLQTPVTEHTKPEGDMLHGSHPGSLREPPMVTQRIGKEHRG